MLRDAIASNKEGEAVLQRNSISDHSWSLLGGWSKHPLGRGHHGGDVGAGVVGHGMVGSDGFEGGTVETSVAVWSAVLLRAAGHDGYSSGLSVDAAGAAPLTDGPTVHSVVHGNRGIASRVDT